MRRRISAAAGRDLPVLDRETRGALARTVAASAAMAAVTGLASIAFAGKESWLWNAGATLALAGIGTVCYTAASRVLKMPELGWALRGK
jgi:hypothetical protein